MTPAWNDVSGASAVGNWSRFVTAKDVVAEGQRGVDFANAFTSENAFAISTSAPASLVSASRENPA